MANTGESENERITGYHTCAPVGICIYCGATPALDALTDEHIFPYGLQGNLVLPKASCEDCARVINRDIEQPLLRKMLGPFRVNAGIQSRTKAKDRQKEFDVPIRSADGNVRTMKLPAADTPIVVFGLQLPLAGILAGRVDGPVAPPFLLVMKSPNMPQAAAAAELGKQEALQVAQLDYDAFMRFLAKVAHGFAAAQFGLDGFVHRLPSIILGRDVEGKPPRVPPNHLIGHDPHPKEESVGTITLVGWDAKRPDGAPLLGVSVDIFPPFDLPRYLVVVGEPTRTPRASLMPKSKQGVKAKPGI